MKYLFEVSWEVCNMVGGIHTVLRTKAAQAYSDYGEQYFLIGPSLEQNTGFIEESDELYAILGPAFESKGLRCRVGRWNLPERPRVILVDFHNRYEPGRILYKYWQRFGVNSMDGSWEYIEPVLFATACGEVIETIQQTLFTSEDKGVAHFHEWMTGGGLLHLKQSAPEIGTVFTTHSTVLGRAMSCSGVDIYSADLQIDQERDAKTYGVPAKSSMEVTCAREADIYTTVSDVTAEEAIKMTGRRPHYAALNGVHFPEMGPLSTITEKSKVSRKNLLTLASSFLGTKLPEHTLLWTTSGRYEFHNKGYDVLLEALAQLNTELKNQPETPPIVVWFLVAANNNGLKPEVQNRISGSQGHEETPGILTHHLDNEHHDPILSACLRLELNNHLQDRVKIIFSPAYVTETDGFFNKSYYDVLSGFDMGIYPSAYEPWGYTPLEALALGVPAVTSDLAGFGRWIQDLRLSQKDAITILERSNHLHPSICDNLCTILKQKATNVPADGSTVRAEARRIAEKASWSVFYKRYDRAYTAATVIAEKRLNSLDTSSASDEFFSTFKSAIGKGPHYRRLTVAPNVPTEIEKLLPMAHNLWWVWHPEACELFSDIDNDLWEATNSNPVLFLAQVDHAKLIQKSKEPLYLKKYLRITSDFDTYMTSGGRRYSDGDAVDRERPVAYFSMEFCIHECLPIYSGGLGVLSGDHMKSASDLNIPLIGMGFMYKNGYFQQQIGIDGMQLELYPSLDPANLPLEAVRDADNQEVRISVPLPGRSVVAKFWKAQVGRISLYLLDTDLDDNHPNDRMISAKLYGGGKRMRIEQEVVLGMGGVQFIEDKLGIQPAVYHLNEGHCGFLLFERIERYMRNDGLDFQTAREMVKASSVFTTHTPVPAGNETFEGHLMREYFGDFAPRISLSIDQLMEMGLSRSDEGNQSFSMTVLALKLSSRANGVSQLHGKVCREMWKDVWSELDQEEVPITSITNGIHITSWIGEDMKRLLSQYLDVQWDVNQDDPLAWTGVDQIPDSSLWNEHRNQKKQMFDILRKKLFEDYVRRGEDPRFVNESLACLNPDILTIGFARRFATYKRATLLFRNRESLLNLLNNPERPVQLIFAGKAHPADTHGKELIRRIVEESRTEEFKGKVFYLENYSMKLGRLLTQGVDVWLNTPVRPHEASGTSGMKTVPNGGLNCSILDGWWAEAYNDNVGFSITSNADPLNRDHQDEMDNNALFNVLMSDVLPSYYNLDSDGIPTRWVNYMKEALKQLAPMFSTMRMVNEYHERLYIPTAMRAGELKKNAFHGIRSLTEWKRSIKARFNTVQVESIRIKGLEADHLPANQPLKIELTVIPGRMKPDELKAELLINHDETDRAAKEPEIIEMTKIEGIDPTVFTYALSHRITRSGTFRYAIRVVPTHPLLVSSQETGLVLWS